MYLYYYFWIIPVSFTEHKKIGTVSMHVLLVKRAVENFDVSTTTVDVLFMFDGELND